MGIVRAQVTLTFPSGDQSGTNTWHIRTTGVGGDGTNVNAAMQKLKDYYSSVADFFWNSGFTAHWNGESITVEANPAPIGGGTAWTVTGGGTPDSGPAGVGYVVSWRSSLATRRGRGRTFHAPLKNGSFDPNDGTLGGTLASAREAANTLVAASHVDNGWAFGVYSAKDGVLRDFTAARVNDRVAYLSSRRG